MAELVTNKQWPSDQLTALTYYVYSLLDNSDHQAGGDSLRGRVPVLVLDLRVSVHSEQGNGMLLHQQ